MIGRFGEIWRLNTEMWNSFRPSLLYTSVSNIWFAQHLYFSYSTNQIISDCKKIKACYFFLVPSNFYHFAFKDSCDSLRGQLHGSRIKNDSEPNASIGITEQWNVICLYALNWNHSLIPLRSWFVTFSIYLTRRTHALLRDNRTPISFSGAMFSMVGDYKRTRNKEKFDGVSDSRSEFSLKKLTELRLWPNNVTCRRGFSSKFLRLFWGVLDTS